MWLRQLIITLYSLAPLTLASRKNTLVPINSDKIQTVLNVSTEALYKHANKLELFAKLDPNGNRLFGGLGHNRTVEYINSWFSEEEMLGYYEVKQVSFPTEYFEGTSNLVIQGKTYNSSLFYYSPSTNGILTAPLALVQNLGCDPGDYVNVTGKIALISRGDCDFALKSVLANDASALAILVFEYAEPLAANYSYTYLDPVPISGSYVPGAMISKTDGFALIEDLKAGSVIVNLTIDTILENRTSTNLIVDTNSGHHHNTIVLGAHTDSVKAGPGINDNGSGVIALMEVAKALVRFRINNAVRFCFWTAEEMGMVGSTKYVESLSATERDSIALYLNIDMIASPNYVYFVLDGDGSANKTSNITLPEGSGDIEKVFVDYFTSQNKKTQPQTFGNRSDHGPFITAGIPSGNLFTGAEGIKTQEEADEYGGTAGEPYDSNYHKAGDNVTNLNYDAWSLNTRAMAHAVATYAKSTTNIPKRKSQHRKSKRSFRQQAFHHSSRGHKLSPYIGA